jgi:hypothetical protein
LRSRSLGVEASQQVKVDVTGVNQLELVTESSGEKARKPKAIWADPVLHR